MLGLKSVVTQTARLARDTWNLIVDAWENESRLWDNIE